MGYRLSKIYTRTGDDGSTGLADGSRVVKDSNRINAIGDIDELNSTIALVLAFNPEDAIRRCLTDIQQRLFDLGSELALSDRSLISPKEVESLELSLDDFNDSLPPLKEFILPGGGPAAAACHLARTVCRRAERSVVSMSRNEKVNKPVLAYLNRLSDLLFVICRVLTRIDADEEVFWQSPRISSGDDEAGQGQ